MRTLLSDMGVKPGHHPLDHGYDEFLGLPESNDYGCTDTTMGAPDSGCLNWRQDRCPRNKKDFSAQWDGASCHPGPLNPWNYSLPLLHNRDVVQQPADLQGTATPDSVPLSFRYAQFAASFIHKSSLLRKQFLVYIAWSHMHVPVVICLINVCSQQPLLYYRCACTFKRVALVATHCICAL